MQTGTVDRCDRYGSRPKSTRETRWTSLTFGVDRCDHEEAGPQQTNTTHKRDAGVHTAVEPRTYRVISGKAGSNASNKLPPKGSIAERTRTSEAARWGSLQRLPSGR